MKCIQTKLKQAIGKIYPRFKPNHQQDPHDLLIILIGLCENLKKLTSYEVTQTLKCSGCGTITFKEHLRNDFSAHIEEDTTTTAIMLGLLEDQLQPNVEVECDNCPSKSQHRTEHVLRLPPVLILKLNRFEYDKVNKVPIKITNDVIPSEAMTLKENQYSIRTVLTHHGDEPEADGNHITATVKTDQGWIKCNDSEKLRNVPAPKDGYIIIYELKNVANDNDSESDLSDTSSHNIDKTQVQKNKLFNCSVCKSRFSQEFSLKQHEEAVHDRNFECTICDSSFSQKSALHQHCESVHKNNENYKCELCNKGYQTKEVLRVHMDSVHEGKKPYECNLCDKIFTVNSSLKQHIESVHEKKKPFNCDTCESSFTLESALKQHLSIHEEKEPVEENLPYGCKYRGGM